MHSQLPERNHLVSNFSARIAYVDPNSLAPRDVHQTSVYNLGDYEARRRQLLSAGCKPVEVAIRTGGYRYVETGRMPVFAL